jgi:hypothetical protein
MFARLGDEHDGLFLRTPQREDISGFDAPGVNDTLDG